MEGPSALSKLEVYNHMTQYSRPGSKKTVFHGFAEFVKINNIRGLVPPVGASVGFPEADPKLSDGNPFIMNRDMGFVFAKEVNWWNKACTTVAEQFKSMPPEYRNRFCVPEVIRNLYNHDGNNLLANNSRFLALNFN